MVSKPLSDQPPRAQEASRSADTGPGERLYHMRIDRNGVWHHEGRPILRTPLVKLFASVLRREVDGDHWLVTPVERGRIEVEDAPFVIVELTVDGSGREQIVHMRTNLDEWVTVGSDHPLGMRLPKDRSQDGPENGPADVPLPYVDVRQGLEGRLTRATYYQLVELGDSHHLDGALRYGVWSTGRFFPLD
ncbi:MAG: DUF1285 domain-containing protein [Geminicoccaceae bacterium]